MPLHTTAARLHRRQAVPAGVVDRTVTGSCPGRAGRQAGSVPPHCRRHQVHRAPCRGAAGRLPVGPVTGRAYGRAAAAAAERR